MLNGFVKLRGALEVWKQVVKIPVFSLNKSIFKQVICEKKYCKILGGMLKPVSAMISS